MDIRGLQTHFLRGTKGLVIQTFDGQLLFSTNNKIYELDLIPEREYRSKEFDYIATEPKPKKRNIPKAKQPWKSSTFLRFRNHTISESMKIC